MNPTLRYTCRLASCCCAVLLWAVATAAGAPVSGSGASQPKSPAGPTWDCLLGGSRNGVAYITFSEDGTFSGYEVLVPPAPPSPKQGLVSVIPGNNGLGPKPGSSPATNRIDIFGACPITGTWRYDSKGRVAGSFLEAIYSTECTTTGIPVSTNLYESFDPTAVTNVFPVTFSLTSPVFTNKATGLYKLQTVSYLDEAPVSTNYFDAPMPLSETNVLASGFSVASPVGTDPSTLVYSNQVTCYYALIPLNTNTFSSSVPYTETNHLPSGAMCITLPVHTNLELITFTERLTRYQDHVPVVSTFFTNAIAIAQTNYLPDGSSCETLPVAVNTFPNTFTERVVCYLNPATLGTNRFESPVWLAETHTLSNGTSCVTLPLYTNVVPGSYEEQITCYGPGEVPISTNVFQSATSFVSTTQLPDGSYCRIAPIRTNGVAYSFGEQTICFASPPTATNSFDSSRAYAQMDVNLDGSLCVTVPIATNESLFTFTEETTCYSNHQAFPNPSTFVSPTAFSATNYLADGSYWETVVVATNTFSGTFTEQMTCYLEPVVRSSCTLLSAEPMNQTVVDVDGSYCITQTVSTNIVPGAYKMQAVTYLTQTDCVRLRTNTVSFVGTVVPGKRLTLVGRSALGGSTYRGVLAVFLPDISGSWRGLKHENGVPAHEAFSLTDSPYTPNSYLVSGTGPGYSYSGLALLSRQRKLALACDVLVGSNYQSTRAVIGGYNAAKASGSAAGLEAPSGSSVNTNRVSFQFSKSGL